MFDGHQVVVYDCCNGYDEFLHAAEGLTGHVLVKSLTDAWDHKGSVFFFIIDKATETNAIWNSIRRGLTCVPVIYIPGSRTVLRERYADGTVYLDRPNIDNLMQSFPKYNAIFLNAHGRSDTLLLRDGRVCGGPLHGNNNGNGNGSMLPHTATCSCYHDHGCYRTGLKTGTLPANAADLIFTNACESMAFGADALLNNDWLFFNSVVKSGVGSFVGTPSFLQGFAGEIELARNLYMANQPLWKIVYYLNRSLEYFYREYPSYIIYGNPFLRMKAADITDDINFEAAAVAQQDLSRTLQQLEERMLANLKLSWVLNNHLETPFEVLNNLVFQAKEALVRSKSYPFSPEEPLKLLSRIEQTLSRSERKAMDSISVAMSEEGSLCVFDHVEKRLAKTPPLNEHVCNSCGLPSLEYNYEGGWKSIRCNRCGIARMRSGGELINSVQINGQPALNTVTQIGIDCEGYWNCAIVRGKKDKISARKYTRRSAKLFISKETPPHYYYLRIYAVKNGEVDVFQKLVNVLPH